jgi:hypothetical protein
MEFKLKNFEEKINDITDQFLSLLDSNYVIDDSITTKFESASSNNINSGYVPAGEEPVNNLDSNKIVLNVNNKVGGIVFNNHVPTTSGTTEPENGGYTFSSIDTLDSSELDRKLEELYQSTTLDEDASTNNAFVFSNANIGSFEGNHFTKKDSVSNEGHIANDKEGYNMANYDGDNSLFSFATVPEDRALTTKRSFSDVLFMDIPWDTKIDIWGGIKSLFTTDIRITF